MYSPTLRIAIVRAEISRATMGGSPCHPKDKDKYFAAASACRCSDVCDLACSPCGEVGFDNYWEPLRRQLHRLRAQLEEGK